MASIMKRIASNFAPFSQNFSQFGTNTTLKSFCSAAFTKSHSSPFHPIGVTACEKAVISQAPLLTAPVRHGSSGNHGTREWQITRHWAVPVPTFYGPVRMNLLNGESVGVRKVFTAFKRLSNGMWIQAHPARHKRVYLRSPVHRAYMRKHVMCTGSEGKRLDLMVRAHFRQKKYYVDDPYKPYEKRYGLDDIYYEQKEFYP